MSYSLIYITTPNKTVARKISKTLVLERLVACANILGAIESHYRWENKLCNSREVALILKTSSKLMKRVVTRVKELHPYECPCIVALPIKAGNPAFLKWVGDEVK